MLYRSLISKERRAAIEELRKRLGDGKRYNRKAIAKDCGISIDAVNDFLNGKIFTPRARTLDKLFEWSKNHAGLCK